MKWPTQPYGSKNSAPVRNGHQGASDMQQSFRHAVELYPCCSYAAIAGYPLAGNVRSAKQDRKEVVQILPDFDNEQRGYTFLGSRWARALWRCGVNVSDVDLSRVAHLVDRDAVMEHVNYLKL